MTNITICPTCQTRIETRPTRTVKRGRLSVDRTDGAFELILPTDATVENIPQYLDLSFAQELTLCLLAGALAGGAAGIVVIQLAPSQNAGSVIAVFSLSGACCGVVWLHSYLTTVRRVMRQLWHNSGAIWRNATQRPGDIVPAEIIPTKRTIRRYPGIPVDLDRFGRWSSKVAAGGTAAISHWTERGPGHMKLFKRAEYKALLAYMVDAGVMVNEGGSVGHVLTAAGSRRLKAINTYGF